MVADLTDHDRRNAAFFVADVWRHLFNRFRRWPTPQEAVRAAHGAAMNILATFEAATRDPKPGQEQSFSSMLARSALIGRGGVGNVYSDEIARAEAVKRYFEISGDNAKASEQSVTIDRKIANMLAKQAMRNKNLDIATVAREVGLSRPSTHERYKLRCARIMAALHRDCPDIFDAKGCPVREGRGTSRIWDDAKVAA